MTEGQWINWKMDIELLARKLFIANRDLTTHEALREAARFAHASRTWFETEGRNAAERYYSQLDDAKKNVGQ